MIRHVLSFGAATLAIGAAVACYDISARVMAVRENIRAHEASIAEDKARIENLQSALRIRARLPHLQQVADTQLDLAPPAPGQYMRSPTMLVAFASDAPEAPRLDYAEAEIAPVDEAPQPRVELASAPRPVEKAPLPQPVMEQRQPRLQLAAAVSVPAAAKPELVALTEQALAQPSPAPGDPLAEEIASAFRRGAGQQ